MLTHVPGRTLWAHSGAGVRGRAATNTAGMVAVISLAGLLAQAMATPAPGATLSPAWTKASPTDKNQTARYVRKESDGTQSSIAVSRQVCACDPIAAADSLETIFQQFPGVGIQRSSLQACGQPASRIVVTGVAKPSSPQTNNIEVLAFRAEPAIYSLTYTFKSPAPLPDAEAALLTLCPHP